MKRRQFVGTLTKASLALGALPTSRLLASPTTYPITQITEGDQQHWFGYYDKWQVDPTGRYALGNQVDRIFRSPTAQDTLRIGLIDLEDGNRWTEIGQSTSWGWQQGCMLQWIPGSTEEVIWNDHAEGEGFVSRIYNRRTQSTRTLPYPIYTLSPDGSFGLGVDFARLQFFRPGYGYPTKIPRAGFPRAPEDRGVRRIDLQTGESQLIISYAQIAAFGGYPVDLSDYYHWFNHLLINPSATRFIFLNRSRPIGPVEAMNAWYGQNQQIRFSGSTSGLYLTRALTANIDGSDVFALNDSGRFSHFIWKGDDIITAWSATNDGGKSAFYEFPDFTTDYRLIDHEAMPENGHNTYVPHTNDEWILNDTYPSRRDRKQTLYLYHTPSRRRVDLGRFLSPETFKGEWRCDLHPRCDQAGQRVFFDSTHVGDRRQMFSIDIRDIVGT